MNEICGGGKEGGLKSGFFLLTGSDARETEKMGGVMDGSFPPWRGWSWRRRRDRYVS